MLQEEEDILLLSILFHCVCVDVMKGYSSHHHHCVMDEMQTQNARCENVRNMWLLAWRKLGAKGQGWANGPMLRSRFKRSSLRTPLAAIAVPGGTMGGVRGQLQFKNCWPRFDSVLTWLCAALLWPGLSHCSLYKPARGERRGEVGVAKKWKEAGVELLNLCTQWMASIVACCRRRRGFMRLSLIGL